jgi:hypothetical protein
MKRRSGGRRKGEQPDIPTGLKPLERIRRKVGLLDQFMMIQVSGIKIPINLLRNLNKSHLK